jgi:hypothetical protein
MLSCWLIPYLCCTIVSFAEGDCGLVHSTDKVTKLIFFTELSTTIKIVSKEGALTDVKRTGIILKNLF